MEFKIARLDKVATIISILTTAFLVCLSIFFIYKVPHGWIFSIVIILIVVISYLLSPKKYLFEGSNLIIEKVIGTKIAVPLEGAEGYIFVPDFNKLKPIRAFGNGGLFGYYGIFSMVEYGTINCQLRSLKNVFIIKSKKGAFAISPLEPKKLEEHCKSMLTGITGKIE